MSPGAPHRDAPGLFLYVQTLLGHGHLARAAALAQAFGDAGYRVDLVCGGGRPLDFDFGNARLHLLPSAHCAEGDFSTLLDETGAPVDEAWKTARRDRLLDLMEACAPALVMLEAFPFGRRQMRFELVPLLDAARAAQPRPLILCSVRDVLQTGRDPRRTLESAMLVEDRFDHVLVHGDPGLIAFGETFPLADRIAAKLHYTGYIGGTPPRPGKKGDDGWDEVIVSAGGGAVGDALTAAALAARPLSRLRDRVWRVLAGQRAGGGTDAVACPQEGVILEPARPDFRQLLANCAVSVSQGGYNTVMDILSAGCRAVIVPYVGEGETEQTFRARRLAERGRAEIVAENELRPESLAAAVDRAARRRPGPIAVDLDGARASVRLVDSWLGRADAANRR